MSMLILGGVRMMLQLVSGGVAGGAAQGLSDVENLISSYRLDDYLKYFQASAKDHHIRIENLEANQQKQESVVSILVTSLDKGMRQSSAEMRKELAELTAKILIADDSLTLDEKLDLFHDLDTLNGRDLRVLRQFHADAIKRPEDLFDAVDGSDDEKFDRIISSLSKLESRGLVIQTNTTGNVVIGNDLADKVRFIWQYKTFGLMPEGVRLVNMLDSKL